MKNLISLMLVLVLSCISLVACGEDEKKKEPATAAAEETVMPASTIGGGFTFDDMPIYPGSDTDKRTWVTISQDDIKSEKRTYETADSLDQVAEFYKSEMPKNGWDQVMWSKTGKMVNGVFNKNNDRDIGQVMIVNTDTGDGVIIALQRIYKDK